MKNGPIKLVYVAGPYRAPTAAGISVNVFKAWSLGANVAKLGALPVVPHKSSEHLDALQSGAWWLEATLELMRRCDAVVLVSGWEESEGTLGEVAEAKRLKIPVFEELSDLANWLEVSND